MSNYLLPAEIRDYIRTRVNEDNQFLMKEVDSLFSRLKRIMDEALKGKENGVFDTKIMKLIKEFRKSELNDMFGIREDYRIYPFLPIEYTKINDKLIYAQVLDTYKNVEKIERVIFHERRKQYRAFQTFYRNRIREHIKANKLKYINVETLLKLVGLGE